MSNSTFRFNTFLPDRSNGGALLTSALMAEYPEEACKQLWLYGESGCGKTHLLKEIYHTVSDKDNTDARFVNAKEAADELVRSIVTEVSGLEKLKQHDYLIVDNMEYLRGKIATQKEFAQLFLDKSESGQKVIIASDCKPCSLPVLYDLYSRRLGQSVVAGINSPSIDLRARYANELKERYSINITQEAMGLLVLEASSIPQIEGALNTARMWSEKMKAKIDLLWMQCYVRKFKR